jgi:hypothetical protein
MEKKIDLEKYSLLVDRLKQSGVNETLAKIVAYEKLQREDLPKEEIYSPFETINS